MTEVNVNGADMLTKVHVLQLLDGKNHIAAYKNNSLDNPFSTNLLFFIEELKLDIKNNEFNNRVLFNDLNLSYETPNDFISDLNKVGEYFYNLDPNFQVLDPRVYLHFHFLLNQYLVLDLDYLCEIFGDASYKDIPVLVDHFILNNFDKVKSMGLSLSEKKS